jgi:hypothetical protein
MLQRTIYSSALHRSMSRRRKLDAVLSTYAPLAHLAGRDSTGRMDI